ncbi:MAG: 50S ribosomal protein L11 methyltransferase, partial [Bacteroidales bacterium]|nr:50S ribosomal protein L11 methyltransferase [Bacteroidales bacterium]
MNYIEINFSINPQTPFQDILIAELAEIGFESFEEKEDGLLAYIQEPLFDETQLKGLDILTNDLVKIQYTLKQILDQNWNALWESNYDSVLIDNRCYIRAPFHPTNPKIEFEILIEPQMSFGTAHHETTANMIKLLLKEDVKDKAVLDMGCGTGVLAILAQKKGANPICAIDNDEWAYRNSIDNVTKNKASGIEVLLGDASLLKNKTFDFIFANINKNILLADMEKYTQCLKKNGHLFMSGFYQYDLSDIQ